MKTNKFTENSLRDFFVKRLGADKADAAVANISSKLKSPYKVTSVVSPEKDSNKK
jgi:hypothetical protein